MNITFGNICCSLGVIYVQIAHDPLPQGCTLMCKSQSASGAMFPAVLGSAKPVPGMVVKIAPLSVPQIITASIVDSSNTTIATAIKRISPLRIKAKKEIERRIGTAKSSIHLKEFWSFEDPDMAIQISEAIPDSSNKTLILHGTVTVSSSSSNQLDGLVEVNAIAKNGALLNDKPWTSMGDSTSIDSTHAGITNRNIPLSLTIPEDAVDFFVCAAKKGPCEKQAFCYISKKKLRELARKHRNTKTPANKQTGYDKWFKEKHRARKCDLELQCQHQFDDKPFYSIIMVLYQAALANVRESIDAALSQSYDKLELVLVNADSEDGTLSDLINEFSAKDSRITVVSHNGSMKPFECTNAGIEKARGDFLCFLNQGDLIEPDTLYWYTIGVGQYPNTDLLFCDEDRIEEEDGELVFASPFFKPDWNIDLLSSRDYVSHMLTVRKTAMDRIVLPTQECDGAEVYDIAFKVGEKARNIYHARRVLYHARKALNHGAKKSANDAGAHAIQGHLDRCGINGIVKRMKLPTPSYSIQYSFDKEPLVSIVIPNKNSVALLDGCISSILDKTTYANYEIVVAENNSDQPETFEYYNSLLSRDSRIRIVTVPPMEQFNFSAIVNYGFEQANGEYLLMLNNDTEIITGDWIESMLGPCVRDDVGAVGAMLLYPDNTIQHAGIAIHLSEPNHIGIKLPSSSRDYHGMIQLAQNCSAVTGACLLTKRSVFNAVKGLDETFAGDYNDVDFCLRIRHNLGKLCIYQPQAKLYHFESVSRGKNLSDEAKLRFQKERGTLMQRYPRYFALGDPYLHPLIAPPGIYRHHKR